MKPFRGEDIKSSQDLPFLNHEALFVQFIEPETTITNQSKVCGTCNHNAIVEEGRVLNGGAAEARGAGVKHDERRNKRPRASRIAIALR